MSGFATFGAGAFPAGYDPVLVEQALGRPAVGSPKINISTRTIELDDQGRVILDHAVDQTVALLLAIPLGTIASAPNTGIRLDRLAVATPIRVSGLVDTEVRAALKNLTTAGDIRINVIRGEKQGNAILMVVDYTNLRLPIVNPPARRITVNIGK